MKEQLNSIKVRAEKELASVESVQELESLRVKYLGKKGELTSVLRGMGALSAEERPAIGRLANEVREFLEDRIEQAGKELGRKELYARLEMEVIDVTVPGKRRELGRKHPLSIVMDEIKEVFIGMGFEIAEGPEVELDYYNFEALNIPKGHPSRDTQDNKGFQAGSCYWNGRICMRTCSVYGVEDENSNVDS
jgi:phenylalanyl-tRNA synthetase alpha chain